MKPNDKPNDRRGGGYTLVAMPALKPKSPRVTGYGWRWQYAQSKARGIPYLALEMMFPGSRHDLSTAQSLELERRAFLRGWC